ncbi:hypothetical protein KFK09_021871 [Dendrobium nobile]|uniref:Uncharacterized protein n=1 Tax=Dendrobium nobile TaxID=94219 RepID=A0A8T3AHG5_DENNO|nr:hypothetical protein KFK09_021871 [Dendrobium nobile]
MFQNSLQEIYIFLQYIKQFAVPYVHLHLMFCLHLFFLFETNKKEAYCIKQGVVVALHSILLMDWILRRTFNLDKFRSAKFRQASPACDWSCCLGHINASVQVSFKILVV